MKINLCCSDDIREGEYLNIGIAPNNKLPSDIYRQGDISALDWVCEDGTVEEILVLNTLNYIAPERFKIAFDSWFSKLSTNGVIKISIVDLFVICKSFVNDQITIGEMINHLWGIPENRKFSSIDSSLLCKMLEDANFRIETKRYDGISFYIEARKNEN